MKLVNELARFCYNRDLINESQLRRLNELGIIEVWPYDDYGYDYWAEIEAYKEDIYAKAESNADDPWLERELKLGASVCAKSGKKPGGGRSIPRRKALKAPELDAEIGGFLDEIRKRRDLDSKALALVVSALGKNANVATGDLFDAITKLVNLPNDDFESALSAAFAAPGDSRLDFEDVLRAALRLDSRPDFLDEYSGPAPQSCRKALETALDTPNGRHGWILKYPNAAALWNLRRFQRRLAKSPALDANIGVALQFLQTDEALRSVLSVFFADFQRAAIADVRKGLEGKSQFKWYDCREWWRKDASLSAALEEVAQTETGASNGVLNHLAVLAVYLYDIDSVESALAFFERRRETEPSAEFDFFAAFEALNDWPQVEEHYAWIKVDRTVATALTNALNESKIDCYNFLRFVAALPQSSFCQELFSERGGEDKSRWESSEAKQKRLREEKKRRQKSVVDPDFAGPNLERLTIFKRFQSRLAVAFQEALRQMNEQKS